MTVHEFIKDLGGATAVARELGIPMTTVAEWGRRNKVPQWRIPQLAAVALAKGRTIPGTLGQGKAA